MVNCMAKIAECLGVEIGEAFRVVQKDGTLPYNTYRITEEKGIEILDYDTDQWNEVYASTFKWLLTSDIKIITRWRPEENEKYYIPFIAALPENRYSEYFWHNREIDMYCYQLGLVCKTEKEAIAMANNMLASIWER